MNSDFYQFNKEFINDRYLFNVVMFGKRDENDNLIFDRSIAEPHLVSFQETLKEKLNASSEF